ncbi:MAG: acyl-CoA thioesterase [Bacteroidales bacterium]
MLVSETQVRVRYSETDQMGYVYYGNYPEYFEVGRAEAMRQLGMTYREMEQKGIMMPIASMNLKYVRPAFYDQLLTIRTIVKELPTSRMHFFYEVYNEKQELLTTGETVLAFIDTRSRRPCPAPDWFVDALQLQWKKINEERFQNK